MTANRSTETIVARLQRRLRILALGIICLALPQTIGTCLIEAEGGEVRIESEVAVRADQGTDKSRETRRAAFLPREPRCRPVARRLPDGWSLSGHSLPCGHRAPLTC